jgi:hypothetical protein
MDPLEQLFEDLRIVIEQRRQDYLVTAERLKDILEHFPTSSSASVLIAPRRGRRKAVKA